jgi:DNA-directed DNA polymerase III (polc)
MKDFVHLHLHTEYSLLDGAARINQGDKSPLVEAVKAKGMKAVAITDHGNMYGVYAFAKALQKSGVKGIIGSEFYVVKNRFFKDPLEKAGNHLILLAKNNDGYQNLMKLSSLSFIEGFYYRPRIDLELLKKYSKGLICLTACIQGAVPELLLQDNYEGAKSMALKLKSLFADGDFYIELQNHGIDKELTVLPKLVRLAEDIGVKVVATNDVHYIEKSDADMQDVLMCISTKRQLNEVDRMKLEPQEFYLKDYDEMYEKFSWCENALDTTVEIADKCNVTVKLKAEAGVYEIPVYEIPYEKYAHLPKTGGAREAAYLTDLAKEGITKRYKIITDEILERLEMELKVIIKMGFAGYYLIVWDFINYSKTHGIPVGPGRGSGVGSIVAYAIGITNVDPLKYDLFFERFLNPERVSMPDFDIDFCTQRRADVISYVSDKYGADHVAQIITYGTLSARAVIKDIARVYSIPYADADKWAKAIPAVPKITLNEALGKAAFKTDEDRAKKFSPDFLQYYEEDIVAKGIIDMALRVENMPRQTGMHAAGVLICPKPVDNYVPLQRSGEYVTTQFDKKQVEDMGLLKMDFLGLNTLTDIDLALDYIEETTGKRPDLDALEFDDPEVFKVISDGDSKAVFQIENEGMRKFMMQLHPDCLEEIIAGVALYRPGPMQFIPDYIKGKCNPKSVHYLHPMLKNVLDVTYGCIVYQEQVMQIAREVAGYSFGGADELRRAMGKKDAKKMQANKEYFINGKTDDNGNVVIEGAVRRGMPREIADQLFEQIYKFAEYAFNKSHATAYSVITYQTAWLKRYYPLHFMVAVLNNRITNSDEVSNYINYLNSINIKVLQPDINKSNVKFSIDGNNVRFGLMAIKNVGEAAVSGIIEERKQNGDFTDLENFINRAGVGVNKRMIESMIKGGVFDCFGKTRATLLASYEQIMDIIMKDKKHSEGGQISLFDELVDDDFTKFKYPDLPEFTDFNKLMQEKEVLGMYVTGHPLNSYRAELKRFNFNTGMLKVVENDDDNDTSILSGDEEIGFKTVNYDTSLNGKKIQIGGVINEFERRFTKKGDSMGTGVIEDLYGQIGFVLYSRTFETYRDLLKVNAFVVMDGSLVIREGELPKVNVYSVSLLDTAKDKKDDVKETVKKLKLIIRGERKAIESAFTDVRSILRSHKGESTVQVRFDWGTSVTPEKVKITNDLVYDLGVVIGRDNIEIIE